MSDNNTQLYSGADVIVRLQRAINALERPHTGLLQFTVIHGLHCSNQGWEAVEHMKGIPGLREFADRLNAAVQPVVQAYAAELRQHLANESTKLGAAALSKEAPKASGRTHGPA